MGKFLQFSYYFSPIPDSNFQYTKLTLAIGLFFLVFGIALSIYRKKYVKNEIHRKLMRKYPGLLRTYGTLIILLLLFRETAMPFLSMRMWWFLLGIFFLYSLFKFLFTYKREYKKRYEQAVKMHTIHKYLPRKKS
jgi:amino acid transporter